jgi:hypothetical protein
VGTSACSQGEAAFAGPLAMLPRALCKGPRKGSTLTAYWASECLDCPSRSGGGMGGREQLRLSATVALQASQQQQQAAKIRLAPAVCHRRPYLHAFTPGGGGGAPAVAGAHHPSCCSGIVLLAAGGRQFCRGGLPTGDPAAPACRQDGLQPVDLGGTRGGGMRCGVRPPTCPAGPPCS